jgi:3-dehydroquinate synthase
MRMIKVKSKIRDYRVVFGKFPLFLSKVIKEEGRLAYYIIDKNVWQLYKDVYFKQLDLSRLILIKADEFNKTLKAVMNLYDTLIEHSAKKNIVLVSIGGGITQDVSGFLASTIYRGVKWVYVPTTLLAQADSCIGGKTSLNYKNYKNLIGTFYPPNDILIDTDFLLTLKELDFYSGIGEIVKLHILGTIRSLKSILRLFSGIIVKRKECLLKAIYSSLLIKKEYIEEDEFDTGKRNLLNYGHCFGHALEKASGFEIPHGQAVVAGMILANIVSRKRGLLSPKLENKFFNELLLPVFFSKPRCQALEINNIIAAMKKDKKRTGAKLPLIIIKDNLSAERLTDLDEKEARSVLGELTLRIK